MLCTRIFALATAAITAFASPTPSLHQRDTTSTGISPYTFIVSSLSYGCSEGGCAWAFNVSTPTNTTTDPIFGSISSSYCQGTDYDLNYTACGDITSTQSISAYIDQDSDAVEGDLLYRLLLKYDVTTPSTGAVYSYFGVSDQYDIPQYCTGSTCPKNYAVAVVSANVSFSGVS